jgi:hypothetical protein
MSSKEVEEFYTASEKLPTITIAILAHGEDLINEKLPEFDPNVRIFSRAGQSLCLGVADAESLMVVQEFYVSEERLSNKNTKSSYQMLRDVANYFNSPESNSVYAEICSKEIANANDTKLIKSLKHTKKTINCKKSNQIYTPSYDHIYDFTDTTNIFSGQSRIAVLETMNYTPTNKVIDYENLPFSYYDNNLALQKYYITQPDIDIRNRAQMNFRKEMIQSFLLNFNLDHDSDSELNKYSDILFKNIPFVDNYKILSEFQNPTSVIHDLVNPDDDKIITEKANEFIGISEITDEAEKSRQVEERRQFLFQADDIEKEEELIPRIKLSDVIAFLKSEGFKVINIIDFSCRYVEDELTEEKIRELNEGQNMGIEEIKTALGIRKKRKTRRRKRHKKSNVKKRLTKKTVKRRKNETAKL